MGMANAYHTKEKYAQIALKLRGQKRNEITRKRISKALMGHKHSPETLAKMRKPRSEEGKINMSRAMKGRIPWNKGKTGIYSQETITKIRKANLGKKVSQEVKDKLRNSMINFFKAQSPLYVPPTYKSNELNRKHESVRRSRIRNNGGYHSREQWNYLKMAFNYVCKMCGRKEPEIKLTKDHIISLKNGGTNDIGNIQPLCRSCNSKKR